MATYNGATYIAEQLDSIASQTRGPDELIVADDRSSDQTLGLVRSFANRAPFPVKVLEHATRVGAAANFERAIRGTTGDLVALCDQDDVWVPEKLRTVEEVFVARPEVAMVFSNARCVSETLEDLGYTSFDAVGFESMSSSGRQSWQYLLGHPFVPGATLAFRAEHTKLVLPLPDVVVDPNQTELIHDGWISVCLTAVAPIAWIDQPLLLYRQHRGQQLGLARPADERSRRVMPAPLELRKDEWRDRAARLALFTARFNLMMDAFPRLAAAVDSGDEEIRHLTVRLGLSGARHARIGPIAREWRTGRYASFSEGLKSAIGDALCGARNH